METNDDHISRLESEIRYLKGLLDENGIPYDFEAYMEVRETTCNGCGSPQAPANPP